MRSPAPFLETLSATRLLVTVTRHKSVLEVHVEAIELELA